MSEDPQFPPQDLGAEGSSRRWLAIIAGAVLLLSIGGFYLILPIISHSVSGVPVINSPETQLTATSLFASTILSIAILLVYWDIGGVQKKQAGIMEVQTRLAMAEHRPLIELSDLSFRKMPTSSWEGDVVSFGIVNVGNGAAFLPSLVVELDFESEEYSPVHEEQLLRPESHEETDSIEGSFKNLQSTIPADGEVRNLSAEVNCGIETEEGQERGYIQEVFQTLFESGVEKISWSVGITVYDLAGEEYNFDLFSLTTMKDGYTGLVEETPESFYELLACSMGTEITDDLDFHLDIGSFSDMTDKGWMIQARQTELAVKNHFKRQGVDSPDELHSLSEQEKDELLDSLFDVD